MADAQPLRKWTIQTSSPEATLALAERLGRLLQPGDVVALVGELGSGKTLFSQGLARGLAVPETFYITSPTFAIINEYPGRIPFYHLDLYRVAGRAELAELGLEEILYGRGAVAIEWAERLGEDLPAERLEVSLKFLGEGERNIVFTAFGDHAEKRLTTLKGSYNKCQQSVVTQ
jgi:tRNA threonylcarbamoyladenosine biosynthesis protein TsaE